MRESSTASWVGLEILGGEEEEEAEGEGLAAEQRRVGALAIAALED